MKVGFLIAGVQKGGTGSLHSYLRKHPQIGMADTKEVHFFDDEEIFRAGTPDYEAYHRRFAPKPAAVIYGEATPIYSYWRDAMARICQYSRGIKIIVLLRNPVQRAWSQWRMETMRKAESLPFALAIRQEADRAREVLPLQHRIYSYLDRGFYAEQIRRARRFFDDRQLMFIKSERFFADPKQTFEEVLRFLDLSPADIDTFNVHNRGSDDFSLAEEDRRLLIDLFREDIHEVESLLGWNCRDWLR